MLEAEVAAAEKRLEGLKASVRALSTEVEATRDPQQFDPDGLRSEWWRGPPPDPSNPGAIAGLFCGGVVGVVISLVVSAVSHLLGK